MRFLEVADGEKRTGILIILTHKSGIGKSLNLYQGQGRKVKGQGQIGIYKQNLNQLKIKNRTSDFDHTRTD